MFKFTSVFLFLVEYLNLQEAVGDDTALWETFQIEHLNNTSLLSILVKSRQVGFSWLAAAESVAASVIWPRTTSVFISINQEEAAEKIRYVSQIINALDKEVRPTLVMDNRLAKEFSNGSRIASHPCKPFRGKAKIRLYLDEFAHYPNDAEVYQSALPAISKGGVVRIGSSPLGARGVFWEIFTESTRAFPGFTRTSVPWWNVRALCKDVRKAKELARELTTEERVVRFGTERLVQIYQNMLVQDFQQEYECAWLDETESWIDWELIKRNQALAAQEKLIYRKVKGVDAALFAIDEIADLSMSAKIESAFVGGMDVGRLRDTTEIILLGRSQWTNQLPYRLHITLDRVEFDKQKAVVRKLLDTLPVTSFLVDRNGLGLGLAENISGEYPQAQGVDFTAHNKELWAIEAKLRAQRAEVPIPLERDFMYQIHSIRRKVSHAKTASFDTEGNESHHADMFWAWALAIWAGKSDAQSVAIIGKNPIADFRG